MFTGNNMAKDALHIVKMEGESARISKEDSPPYIFQKMENLRPSVKVGSAISRDPYTNKITSGLTSLQVMKEFTNKNDVTDLVVVDSNAIKVSVNSGGSYAALASAANDERTALSTVYGSETNPVIVNGELRSGAGLNATTDRPFWYGHIPERKRFNDAQTITAGKYLDEQIYHDKLNDFIDASPSSGTVTASNVSGVGLDAGYYAFYFSPVLDGYQRSFPEKVNTAALSGLRIYNQTNSKGSLKEYIHVHSSNAEELKRLTAIDVFLVELGGTPEIDNSNYPSYFLQRIDINEDSDSILELSATLDNTPGSEKITVADFVNWETCDDMSRMFIHDMDNDEYYRIFSQSHNGTDTEFTTNPVVSDSGSVTIRILSRWYDDGAGGKYYAFLYDNYYKLLGSEMYAYLGLPAGDSGLSDSRYKYYAWNGSRGMIGGRPSTERNFTYFTPTNRPDVFPALNIVRHKSAVTGLTTINQDFLVFTEVGVERIRIIDDENAYQDEEYSNMVLSSHRSIVKIDDNTIWGMSYQGPFIISGRDVNTEIGWHLREWWHDNFSKAQMEACVAGYNFKEEEVWFSFPTYSTSPYTNGIIFVYDMKARKSGYQSAWWRVKTDVPVLAFETNNQFNLLGGGATKIVDFNTAGSDENVQWKMKLKLIENPLLSKKVRFDRLYVDLTTSDTLNGECYFDGSGTSGLTLTFDGDERAFIRYISKTLEVELLNSSASTNSAELKRVLLTFKSLRR